MDGSTDKGKPFGNDLDDDLEAPWQRPGCDCQAFKAIDGKRLTSAFDADLGCALDYPPLAPDSAWRARSAAFGRIAGIMAIVLVELVSLSVRPGSQARVTPKANVAIARSREDEQQGISASRRSAPKSVRRTSRKLEAPTAPAVDQGRYNAPTNVVRLAPGQRRFLGIDEEPVISADARAGMRITRVYPGTAAHAAGLRSGDVLRSANGYLTERRGNLAWIIAYSTRADRLDLVVTKADDGRDHAIAARLGRVWPGAVVADWQSASACFCGTSGGFERTSPVTVRTVVYWPQSR